MIRPSELRPTHFIDSLSHVDPAQFVEKNPAIRAITYDVDGTLTDYHGDQLPKAHLAVLAIFSELGLWQGIVSNAQSESRHQRVLQLAESIGSFIGGELTPITSRMVNGQRKPKVDMFERASQESGQQVSEMAHFGDQVIKDVLGANRAGFGVRVLVARYGHGDDWRVRWFQRPLEALVVRPLSGPHRTMKKFPSTLTLVKKRPS